MTTDSLPQSVPAQEGLASGALLPDSPSSGHILVVEDDELLRESLGLLLDEEGYRVSLADNGREALRQLHAGLHPDLIVLDLRMPIMDGWQFRAIQKADPTFGLIPIVAVSADDSAQAAAISAHAYLQRPVESRALLETIERVLGEAATTTARAAEKKPRLTAVPAQRRRKIRGRILVIDDEAVFGRTIARAFRDEMEVCVAESELEAISLLEGDRTFDVILCEVRLPGSNGPRIYTALAARWPQLLPKLVFTCASMLPPTTEAFVERLSIPVLPKPFPMERLRRLVVERLTPTR